MSEPQRESRSFFEELKRRRVVRVAIGYGAAVFVALQAADLVFPAIGIPEWGFRLLVIGSLAGFPVALVLAWLFDLSPEGLRRTGDEDEGRGRLVARLRPRALAGVAGAALLTLLAGLGWFGLRSASAGVVAGADVVAVLPFQAEGAGDPLIGRGMVDLLSRNLDEIGTIRTVDPRAVLHRWESRAREAPPTLETAVEIGRDMSAGSVLTGSIVEVGSQVRMSAELTGIDGDRIAAVTVDGEPTDLLGLVDSLSVELLRAIWRARTPVPSSDLAAITTGNLEALRAFLVGEGRYRASDWELAADAYQRAVAADSAFALAWFRLGMVAGWGGSLPLSQDGYLQRALRFSDRLPTKVGGMIRAERMAIAGRRDEALDLLRGLVRRHSDDAELWLQIADVEFHRDEAFPRSLLRPLEERLRPFERALELDPTLVPALIHPLEMAFQAGDAARIGRYAAMLDSVPLVASAAVRTIVEADSAMRAPDDRFAVLSALSRALNALEAPTADLRWQAGQAVYRPLVRTIALSPAREKEVAIEWIAGRVEEEPGSEESMGEQLLASLLLSAGRVEEARDALATPAEASGAGGASGTAAAKAIGRLARTASFAGLVEPGDPLSAALPPVEREARRFLDALDAGDARAARARIDAWLRVAAAAADSSGVGSLLRAARGLAEMLEGREDAAQRVERALTADGRPPVEIRAALALRWLELGLEGEEGRGRAEALAGRPWGLHPAFELERIRVLARALEARGERETAARWYRLYADALAGADPGPAARRAEAARDAAQRLAAAPGGGEIGG